MWPKAAEQSTTGKEIFGNLPMQDSDILVVTSAYACPQPVREWRMPSFLGGKSCGAFGQPAFFLAGNHMTIVVFEKEVFNQ